MAYTVMVGGISVDRTKITQVTHEAINANHLKCPDIEATVLMEEKLAAVKEAGDTVGGIVEIVVRGCPKGLGEPVFDKIDADIAKALMSIGTVKGVEIGSGFAAAGKYGSENNDILTAGGYLSNDAGGILAGITNGNDIVVRVGLQTHSLHCENSEVPG